MYDAETFNHYKLMGQAHVTTLWHWVLARRWVLGGSAAAIGLLVAGFLILCVSLISPNQRYVLEPGELTALSTHSRPVGLVLGAGITKNGKPFKELQARLDVAAAAMQAGAIRKILLSGDNRFPWYDEPTAMKDYLVQTYDIDPAYLQVDYAGRSTYESCDRAANVFGLTTQPVVLFSAGSHLPRAIYLCRHFGVQAYGVSSHLEANNATRRELIARAKAVFNVYVYGEQTILGAPIHF